MCAPFQSVYDMLKKKGYVSCYKCIISNSHMRDVVSIGCQQ